MSDHWRASIWSKCIVQLGLRKLVRLPWIFLSRECALAMDKRFHLLIAAFWPLHTLQLHTLSEPFSNILCANLCESAESSAQPRPKINLHDQRPANTVSDTIKPNDILMDRISGGGSLPAQRARARRVFSFAVCVPCLCVHCTWRRRPSFERWAMCFWLRSNVSDGHFDTKYCEWNVNGLGQWAERQKKKKKQETMS